MPTLEQVNNAVGYEMPPIEYSYTTRDVCLYALGVGAPADWLDQDELKFVYELSGEGFKALPSFATIYISGMIQTLLSGNIAGIEYNPMMLVHGEQSLEIKKTLPIEGTVTCHQKITHIYDKGSGLLMVTEVTCKDEQGADLAVLESGMFIRGIGDFGGERGPSSKINMPPEREPDVVHAEQTLEKQALIYRLSGDINPLHADPNMAAVGGFDRPILHGLATFGFATRALIRHYCDNDPDRLKSMHVRFSSSVFPGETLVTEMWQESATDILFQVRVKERDNVVLSNARAVIV